MTILHLHYISLLSLTILHLHSISLRSMMLMIRIRNRHNERPIDLLPPSYPGVDPESDDEKIRAGIRRAEAEAALGASGDVVDGESLPCVPPSHFSCLPQLLLLSLLIILAP
jgi:hypothetical protein